MDVLVEGVYVLVEIHVVLVILHLVLALGCVFLLCSLVLVLRICTVVAHSELLLFGLGLVLHHHALIYSRFDLFMHALIKIITWGLSCCLSLLEMTSCF